MLSHADSRRLFGSEFQDIGPATELGLDELENKCTSDNFSLFAISVPKIFTVGGNDEVLTKL